MSERRDAHCIWARTRAPSWEVPSCVRTSACSCSMSSVIGAGSWGDKRAMRTWIGAHRRMTKTPLRSHSPPSWIGTNARFTRFLGGGGGGILWTDVKTQNEENSGDKEFVAKKIISQPNYMDQAPFLHLPYVLHFRWVTLLNKIAKSLAKKAKRRTRRAADRCAFQLCELKTCWSAVSFINCRASPFSGHFTKRMSFFPFNVSAGPA